MASLILPEGTPFCGSHTPDTRLSCRAATTNTATTIADHTTAWSSGQALVCTHAVDPRPSVWPGAQVPHRGPWRLPAHVLVLVQGHSALSSQQ